MAVLWPRRLAWEKPSGGGGRVGCHASVPLLLVLVRGLGDVPDGREARVDFS